MDLSCNESDRLKAQLETYKVENENLKNKYDKTVLEYELKLEKLKNEIDGKCSLYEDITLKLNELDDKFKSSCKEKIDINQQLQNSTEEKLKLSKEFNELESEHNRLLETICRRETELVNSKSEVEQLKASVKNYETLEIQYKVKNKDYESLNSDFMHTEKVLKQTNLRLSERVKDLENKLQATTNELFEMKSDYNKQIYNLNIDLDNKRTEIKTLKRNTEKIRHEMTLIEKVKEEQSISLQNAIESQTNIDNVLRNEIQVQRSLAELYKEERDECQCKEKRLIDAVTNLQNALRDACSESDRVKQECENRLKTFSQQLEVLSHNLESKKKELESANELMEKFRVNSLSEQEMRSMNPSTAVGISALKRGYSITQIYCEYEQVVNERDEIKLERDRLNEYIKDILDELEQKAPMLKKHHDEHSSLEAALSTVTKKYDEISEQYLASQADHQNYQEKCITLQKQLAERDQECKDLSRQICYLLREIETSRGTVIRSTMGYRGNEIELARRMGGSNKPLVLMEQVSQQTVQPTNAQGVITNYLVTFKNIIELQQQNQQLIKQIRLLSEEHEQIESIVNEQSVDQLARSLDKSFKEIQDLRGKQKQNEQLESVIEQQRHIIQALHCKLTEGGESDSRTNSDMSMAIRLVASSTGKQLMMTGDNGEMNELRSGQVTIKEMKDALKESQKKCEALDREIKELFKQRDEMKEKYRGEIDVLQNQLSENKISNASLLGKVTHSQDQNKVLEQNLINRQLEMNDLDSHLSTITHQLEQKSDQLKQMKNQLQQANDSKQQLELDLRQTRDELELTTNLRQQIQEERTQKQELLNMKNLFSEQIESLKNMMVNMPSKRFGSGSECDEDLALQAEVRHLQLQLKQEKLKYDAGLEIWRSKLADANIKIESLTQQNQKQQIEANSASGSRIEKRLNSTLMTTENVSDTLDDSGLLEIKNQNEMEKSIDNLTKSNETLQSQIETFKSLLEEAENKIISNTEFVDNLNHEFEAKLDEEKTKSIELEKSVASYESELQTVNREKDELGQHVSQQLEEFTEKLAQKESEITEVKNKENELTSQIDQLKKDTIRLHNSLQEITDNYHQELIFHAQDSEDLKVSTEKLKHYQTQETENLHKLQELETERDTLHILHTNLQAKFDEETKSRDKDLEQVRKERAVLVAQTAQLTDTVVSLKKMLDPSLCGEIERSVLEKESDWTDVIRYLRDEKEISEKNRLTLEHDLKKLQTTNTQLQNQIRLLQDALEEEKSLQQQETETHKHHVEVMRELEQLEMIKESNAKLREDRKRLQDDLDARQKQITQLKQLSEPNSVDLKQKQKRIQELEVDVSCLEKEREHWREMSNNLISRLNQVNPEEFQKICDEKQELLGKISELEGSLSAKSNEMTENQDNLQKNIDELNQLKESATKHQQELQTKESTIFQLKEIGRRYKSETETLKSKITEVNNQANVKDEEIAKIKQDSEKVKEELSKSKLKIQQLSAQVTSAQQASKQLDESEVQKRVNEEKRKLQEEMKVRNNITTKKILKLTEQYDKLKHQMEVSGVQIQLDDDTDENSTPNKSLITATTATSSLTTTIAAPSLSLFPSKSSIATTSLSAVSGAGSTAAVPSIFSIANIASDNQSSTLSGVVTTTAAVVANQTQPPIARVTASIQPTNLSKPIMSSAPLTSISMTTGTSTISTTSNQVTPIIQQAARQTVEIRPIPIIAPQATQHDTVGSISTTTTNSVTNTTSTPISLSTLTSATATSTFQSIMNTQDTNAQSEINSSSSIPTTTTTSLPANVVQVLSSSSLMFPTATSPATVPITTVSMEAATSTNITSSSINRKRVLPTNCENITSSTSQATEPITETTSVSPQPASQLFGSVAVSSGNFTTVTNALLSSEPGPSMKKARINLFTQSNIPVSSCSNSGISTTVDSSSSLDVTRTPSMTSTVKSTSSIFSSVPVPGFSTSVFGSSASVSTPVSSSIFKTSVKSKQDFSDNDDDVVNTVSNIDTKQQKEDIVFDIDDGDIEDIDDVGEIDDEDYDDEFDDEECIVNVDENCRKKLMKTTNEEENEDVIELSSSGNDSESGEIKDDDDDVTIQSESEEKERNVRLESKPEITSGEKRPIVLKITRKIEATSTSATNKPGTDKNLEDIKRKITNPVTSASTPPGNPITVIGGSNLSGGFAPNPIGSMSNTPTNEMRPSRITHLPYSHRTRGMARRHGNFGRSFNSNLARRSGRRYL